MKKSEKIIHQYNRMFTVLCYCHETCLTKEWNSGKGNGNNQSRVSMSWYRVCIKCRCKKSRVEMHHVTYSPERLVPLCPRHHSVVTKINTKAAKSIKRKLGNLERSRLFSVFMKTPMARRAPLGIVIDSIISEVFHSESLKTGS